MKKMFWWLLFLKKLRLENYFKDRSLEGKGINTDFLKIQEKLIGE